MNVNEVLANRATEMLGGPRGERAARASERRRQSRPVVERRVPDGDAHRRGRGGDAVLLPALRRCATTLSAKAERVRRHRQDRPHAPAGRDAADARPGVLAATWRSSSTRRRTSRRRCRTCCELALGGTAVGTGLNTHPEFGARVAADIAAAPACRSSRRPTSSRRSPPHDALVAPARRAEDGSPAALMKIANDVRWLASGTALGLRRDHDSRRTSRAARSCRARSIRRSARR